MDGWRGRLRSLAAAVAVAGLVAVIAASCAPPPPACPPEAQRLQPAAVILGITDGNPFQSLFSWLASWWWSNPENCPPPDPEGPPAVVPEAPLAVLLPGVALLSAGLGLIVVRRRRLSQQPI